MREAVGFIEFNSIAKGIEAADIVLKTADVKTVFSKAGCPGKYYLLISGDVAAVKSSVDAGIALAGDKVIDSCIIPNIDSQVVHAVNLTAFPEHIAAVGVMEYYSVTASIYGADAAVKAAEVQLVEVRLGTGIGGKSFVILTGDVAAVREAVAAGISTPNAEGMVISSVVIPSPHKELVSSLVG